MKKDLNAMESDDGLNLPPYISRSTAVPLRHCNDPAWMAMREIFAKHEQTKAFNNQQKRGH